MPASGHGTHQDNGDDKNDDTKRKKELDEEAEAKKMRELIPTIQPPQPRPAPPPKPAPAAPPGPAPGLPQRTR